MSIYDITTSGIAALASRADGQTPVSGVLIGEGDVTNGLSNKRTRWPASVLEAMAGDDLFEGKPITMADSLDPEQHAGVEVTDEGAKLTGAVSMDEKVGEITETVYEPGVGLLYEGFVADDDAAGAVEAGLAQVSPVVIRDIEQVEEDLYEPTEVLAARDVAIVADGAVPSNEIDVGNLDQATEVAEALSAHFGTDVAVEALQRDQARRPTYSDTTGAEWSTPTLEDYLSGYDSLPSPDDVDSVADLDDEGRSLIADKSLLGTPDGETLREVRFFPVVDPDGDALNRRALGAVRSGRGAQADIPDDALASAERMAGELLNDEFDADVDVEAAATGVGAQTSDHPGGDDGSNGGMSQSTPALNGLPTMDDLTDKEQELVAAARQKDDPMVVEAEVPERLTDLEEQIDEHEELIEEAADLEDPTVQSAEEAEAMAERVAIVEEMMAEALTEQKGLREATVEAMSFDAMAAEFESDEGDLDVEALTQNVESGSGSTGTGDGDTGPTDDDVERIQEINQRIEALGGSMPADHREQLKEEAAELAGTDDYDAALEVL